ncbi:putative pollen-specific leucine-rich repeat extensin-like protein 3 [Iris pallida]|uniref:Pollen-specific leucine-rich repeat extensin-like protein 3 n=1 Tax=Iris pallida TaxID=29817 RepID=A0AAX6IK09_IRIPA|nr:putative pollen-specific leucine-rich repeat extensin-like protein 3 [Iris pallida]
MSEEGGAGGEVGSGAGVLGTIVALRALALEERGSSRVAILDSGQLWGTGLRWYIWWCVWLRRRKFCVWWRW